MHFIGILVVFMAIMLMRTEAVLRPKLPVKPTTDRLCCGASCQRLNAGHIRNTGVRLGTTSVVG